MILAGIKGHGRTYSEKDFEEFFTGGQKDKKKSKSTEFTTEELNVIAKALNILKIQTPKAIGVSMNTYHMTRFYNETHYIDSAGTFKVYKKYKGWKPNEEKTW